MGELIIVATVERVESKGEREVREAERGPNGLVSFGNVNVQRQDVGSAAQGKR